MNLHGWTWQPYDLPLRTPYQWAKGIQTRRLGLIAKLDLGDAAGWGEAAPPPHESIVPAALARGAARLVEGLDPTRDDFLARLDERNPHPRLRCALSTAYCSAHAARAGVPLGAWLAADSGRPPPVQSVPVNTLLTGDTDLGRLAQSRWDAGFRTFKIKVGADRALDLSRVAAVREAVPDATIRLDANESWNPGWALEHMQALALFEIEYVEQPLPAADPGALVRLSARSPIPVALDESATDAATLASLLDSGAGTVAILKPQRLGGPDKTLAAVDAARDHGALAVITNSLETVVGRTTSLHLAALLSAPIPACGLATEHYLSEDLAPGATAKDGFMQVPQGPGLGVTP